MPRPDTRSTTLGEVDGSSKTRRTPYVLGSIFVVLAAGIAIAGYLYYRSYEQQYRAGVEGQLSAIAEMKASGLAEWREDRLGDSAFFSKNAAFSALVRRYFDNPGDLGAREELQTWLGKYPEHHGYDQICLTDTQGVTRMSVPAGNPPVSSAVMDRIPDVLRSGQATLIDFHNCSDCRHVDLALLVPIFDETVDCRPLGVVALCLDPQDYLYPYIRRWPTPSETAETLLVRRDGNDALFLNELRFQKNTTLSLRVPLTRKDMPVVKAALGQEGIVEGSDYRGVPVIAAVRAVPDSLWFLVARMDVSEAYAPVTERLWLMIVLVGVLLLAAGAGVGLVWRQQSVRFYRENSAVAGTLRESEAIYRTLVENIPQKVFMKDWNLRYVSINENYARDLGIRPADAVGKVDYDFFPKELADKYRADDRRIMETGRTDELQEKYIQEGKEVWVQTVKAPVRDQDGKIVGVFGIFWDITERKRMEDELRRLAVIAEQAAEGIAVADLDGNLQFVNHAWARMHGYESGAELVGKHLRVFHTDEQLKTEVLPFNATVKRQGHNWAEVGHVRRDGTTFPTQMSVVVLKDEQGEPYGLGGLAEDITNRKRAEEERCRLAAILEATPDFVGFADAKDAHILYINKGGRLMTGLAPDEDVTRLKIPDVHPDWTNRMLMDTALPAAGRDGIWTGECAFLHRNGQEIPVLMVLLAHKNSAGEVECFSTISRDISERKRAEERLRASEEALRQAKNAAEAANAAKSRFLANMSHEIRSPMTAVLGFAELLADSLECRHTCPQGNEQRPRTSGFGLREQQHSERCARSLTPEARSLVPEARSPTPEAASLPACHICDQNREYVRTICASGRHLLSVINDILDLSKIEAGKMPVEAQACRLMSVIAEVASIMRIKAQQRGVDLIVQGRTSLPETIATDAAHLRQALVNLVGNAIKFTERGSVKVAVAFVPKWRNGQPAVAIQVIDTGIGIAPDALGFLFQPFAQADSSTSRKYGGSGLGLAISRRIAELLGGELVADSVLGKGSTFTLTIPTGPLDGVRMLHNPVEAMRDDDGSTGLWPVPEEHRRDACATAPTPLGSLVGLRVLLVEDGPDNQRLIKAFLEKAGANVEVAPDGRIAIDKVQAAGPFPEKGFDVILMDMQMPDMDGYTAVRMLRQSGYSRPVVALTAHAMSGDRESCLACGCDDYLAKPVDRTQLVESVARWAASSAPPQRNVQTRKTGRDAGDTKYAKQVVSKKKPSSPASSASLPSLKDSMKDGQPRNADADDLAGAPSEFSDDPAMVALVDQFVAGLPEKVASMQAAHRAGCHQELQRLAHQLKGAAGGYGYPALSETAKALEDAAKAEALESEALILQEAAQLCAAIGRGRRQTAAQTANNEHRTRNTE